MICTTSFDFMGHLVLCHYGRTEREKKLAHELNELSIKETLDAIFTNSKKLLSETTRA